MKSDPSMCRFIIAEEAPVFSALTEGSSFVHLDPDLTRDKMHGSRNIPSVKRFKNIRVPGRIVRLSGQKLVSRLMRMLLVASYSNRFDRAFQKAVNCSSFVKLGHHRVTVNRVIQILNNKQVLPTANRSNTVWHNMRIRCVVGVAW